uniref:Uncharacterized protein n=1 Tax=Anguilla anguilla TaxID=7936 RepID=A0A0E9RFK0_ANGAN
MTKKHNHLLHYHLLNLHRGTSHFFPQRPPSFSHKCKGF